MSSKIERHLFATSGPGSVSLASENGDAVRTRIESYLRAWRLPEQVAREFLDQAMLAAHCHVVRDGGNEPTRAAIDKIDEQILKSLGLANALESEIQPEAPLAMLCDEGQLPRAFAPQRERLTHVDRMQTSLSRLPSFRIIAGWSVIIIVLFLAFLFTH